MVRHDDPVAPEFGGAHRIGRVHDPLDDERARKEAPVFFEVAPGLGMRRDLRPVELDGVLGARPGAGVRQPVF